MNLLIFSTVQWFLRQLNEICGLKPNIKKSLNIFHLFCFIYFNLIRYEVSDI